MSRETAEARLLLRDAAGKTRGHVMHCRAFNCQDCATLRAAERAARRALEESRSLDRLPIPGQEAMF